METTIRQRRLGYYANIYLTENRHLMEILNDLSPGSWLTKRNNITDEIKINRLYLTNKRKWKEMTKTKLVQHFTEKIKTTSKDKTKLKSLVNKSNWDKLNRKVYMNKLTRTQCHYIISARTRMIKVKDNYKNQYEDLICRGCGLENETQTHILEHCIKLHSVEDNIVKENDIFSENPKELTTTANKIRKTLETLEERIKHNHPTNQQINNPSHHHQDEPGNPGSKAPSIV